MYPKCSLSDSNIYLQIVGLLSLVIIMIIAWFYYMRVCHNTITENYYETVEINKNTIQNIPDSEMEPGNRSTFPLDKYPGRRPELVSTYEKQIKDVDRKSILNTTNDKYTLRPCNVYFTENIKACDEQTDATNPLKTCSYNFDGWSEFASYTDANGKVIDYPRKIYKPDASNTDELINSHFTSKCFKEFSNDGQGYSNRFTNRENALIKFDSKGFKDNTEIDTNIFGGKRYTSMQFLNSASASDNFNKVIDSICSVRYDKIPTITNKQFYKFVLDADKKITRVDMVQLNPEQTGFIPVSGRNALDGFANLGSTGLKFATGTVNAAGISVNNELAVFIKTATAKPVNIKIFKFTYVSYLCESSQIKMSTMTPFLIADATSFMNFGNASGSNSVNPFPNKPTIANYLTKYFPTIPSPYTGTVGYTDEIISDIRGQIAKRQGEINSGGNIEINKLEDDKKNKERDINTLILKKNQYSPNDTSFEGVVNLKNNNGSRLFNYTTGYNNTMIGVAALDNPNGATITCVSSTDICITYSTVGSFTLNLPTNYTCDILVVGGGGGGGNHSGGNYECGGGGAGGYLYNQNIILTSGSYTITVGAGGEKSTKGSDSEIRNNNATTDWSSAKVCANEWEQCSCPGGIVRYGANGRYAGTKEVASSISCTNNVFGDPTPGIFKRCDCAISTTSFRCEGGGKGGHNGANAENGGSGGGGLWGYGNYGVANDPTKGFNGATGTTNNGANDGGGGGGAGGPGILKNGGIGKENNITGEYLYYAGGGGGCSYHSSGGGIGGSGIGGTGSTSSAHATDGRNNTGSGGGGGYYIGPKQAGRGGSGIVIIRIKNIISRPNFPTELEGLYNLEPTSTISLAQNKFQFNIITAFIFLQAGYYRFRADLGDNGVNGNSNIQYAELMIYDETHNSSTGYNGRTVFKYVPNDDGKMRPSYLRPYIQIPKSKFFKLTYGYISYNTNYNPASTFIVKHIYSATEPAKDDIILGDITSIPTVTPRITNNEDKIMIFNNTGQGQTTYDVNIPANCVADILVVGGGGAGGSRHGGGGGGGAVVYLNNQTLTKGRYKIMVGAGGTGITGHGQGSAGNDSSISFNNTNKYLARGGGSGNHWSSTGNGNRHGGSGGGGGDQRGEAVSDNIPAGVKGNPGGTTQARGPPQDWAGGGGGGAGERGQDARLVEADYKVATFYEHGWYGGSYSRLGPGWYDINNMGLPNDSISSVRVPNGLRATLTYHGGFQGDRVSFTSDTPWVGGYWNDQTSGIIVENIGGGNNQPGGGVGGKGGNGISVPISGSDTYYGGGGGGGIYTEGVSPGLGGVGGGGAGSKGTATHGQPGTGGGGGGAGFDNQGTGGGNGGSGIVIIRYRRMIGNVTPISSSITLNNVSQHNEDSAYSSSANILNINTDTTKYILSGKDLYRDYKNTQDPTIMNIFSTIKYNGNTYRENYQALASYLGQDSVDYYGVKTLTADKNDLEKKIVAARRKRDSELSSDTTITELNSLLNSILTINYKGLITLPTPTLLPNIPITTVIPSAANYYTYEKISTNNLVNHNDLLTPTLTPAIYIEALS